MKFKAEKDLHRSAEQYYLTLGNLAGAIQQLIKCTQRQQVPVNVFFLSSILLLTVIRVVIIFAYLSSQAMEAVPNTAEKMRYKIAILRMNKNTA